VIDEEIRLLEREVASGDKAKAFDLARLRGRVGLGPAVSQIDFTRKTLVDHELFDTEIAMPPREVLFFARNWTFDNGDRKNMGGHTNHLGASNSLPAGFAMAATGLRLMILRPVSENISIRMSLADAAPGAELSDLIRVLEGRIRFAVGVHDEGREWPARDAANGIKLDGPLVLEELVLFEASWSPSDNDPFLADPRRSHRTHVRLILSGVLAKPPG